MTQPRNLTTEQRLARLRTYAAADGVTGEQADEADRIADLENREDENGYAFLLRLYDDATSKLGDEAQSCGEAMAERDTLVDLLDAYLDVDGTRGLYDGTRCLELRGKLTKLIAEMKKDA